MKAINWKSLLAGFSVYFLVTRPLLAYALPEEPILIGTETEPSTALLWTSFVWHVLAAFLAGLASSFFTPRQELVAAPLMGTSFALIDAVRALRLFQDPGYRPGFFFMLLLFAAVIVATTAGGFVVARIRART